MRRGGRIGRGQGSRGVPVGTKDQTSSDSDGYYLESDKNRNVNPIRGARGNPQLVGHVTRLSSDSDNEITGGLRGLHQQNTMNSIAALQNQAQAAVKAKLGNTKGDPPNKKVGFDKYRRGAAKVHDRHVADNHSSFDSKDSTEVKRTDLGKTANDSRSEYSSRGNRSRGGRSRGGARGERGHGRGRDKHSFDRAKDYEDYAEDSDNEDVEAIRYKQLQDEAAKKNHAAIDYFDDVKPTTKLPRQTGRGGWGFNNVETFKPEIDPISIHEKDDWDAEDTNTKINFNDMSSIPVEYSLHSQPPNLIADNAERYNKEQASRDRTKQNKIEKSQKRKEKVNELRKKPGFVKPSRAEAFDDGISHIEGVFQEEEGPYTRPAESATNSSRPREFNIRRPRRIGINVDMMYMNEIIVKGAKFVRVPKNAKDLPKKKNDLNQKQVDPQNLIKFDPDEIEKLQQQLSKFSEIKIQENQLNALYQENYANFNQTRHDVLAYIQDAMKCGLFKFGQQDDQILDEEGIKMKFAEDEDKTRQIFSKIQEMEFNSIAYFFEQVPKVNENMFKFQWSNEAIRTVEKAFQQKLIDNHDKEFRRILLESEEFEENDLDDNNMKADNYYQRKLNNLDEIKQNYLELKDKPYKYTFQKFNNDRQFKEKLPIYCRKKEFLEKFPDHQVMILQSSAGSGKSTQLPQYLLEASDGRTVITEPRGIAVSSVSNRVRAEISSAMAPTGLIGHVLGPNFDVKALTKVLYLTEHEFMNQMLRDKDKFLDCFETFVLDEAHELRKPQIVIMAVLRNYLKDNPKKKLIVTSATLESNLFAKYFEGFSTCLIKAETPTYSVQIHYNKFPDLDSSVPDNTLAHIKEILAHIKSNHSANAKKGKVTSTTKDKMPNILVFLPHIPDIKKVMEKRLEDSDLKNIQSEGLHFIFEEFHGALNPTEKNKVLNPIETHSGIVRIILSTNIAETAVTIDNIVYVLDSGKEREHYHDEITTLSTMNEVQISKSSAIQRKGRAGRVCNGYCYRMYTLQEYEAFEESKKPDIVRMDISDTILMLYELADYVKSSDLLFYSQIQAKVMRVTGSLTEKGCFSTSTEVGLNRLSNKGKFMVESNLEASTAAFLYENLIIGNEFYGIVASAILERPSGYFRDNDILRNLAEREIGLNSDLIRELGDLGPIIYLVKKYDTHKYEEIQRYDKLYGIKEADFKFIRKDLNSIE